jgi:SET domain-containing protein
VKGSVLMDYMFKISSDLYVLALGSGSVYNHRNQPNARWEYDVDKQLLKLSAIRRIEMGEQIFISYGRDYFKSRNKNMKA